MTHPIANDRTHPSPFSMEGANTLTALSLYGAALATAAVAWNIIRKGNQVQMRDIGILGVSWALFGCAKLYDLSRQNQNLTQMVLQLSEQLLITRLEKPPLKEENQKLNERVQQLKEQLKTSEISKAILNEENQILTQMVQQLKEQLETSQQKESKLKEQNQWLITRLKQKQIKRLGPKPTSIVYSFLEGEKDKKSFAHVDKETYEICAIQELTMKLDQIRLEYLIDNAKKIHYPYQQLIPNLDLGPLATTFTENLEHTTKCIAPDRKEEDDLAYPKGFNKVRAFVTTTLKNAEALQKLFPAAITTQLPSIFGPAKWNRYFGEIGAVPPLPKNIADILNSPCPYWEGKKVYETHMLTLIPATLNGTPFTLNLLGQIIKTPQGEGHAAKYYSEVTRTLKERGDISNGPSTWSLITKDVIPESRNKSYNDQTDLLKREYSTPKALELATAIFMHHVETGERLYSDNPNTHSRCEEKVDNNQWRMTIGSFGASGLYVGSHSGDHSRDDGGLAGSRKF